MFSSALLLLGLAFISQCTSSLYDTMPIVHGKEVQLHELPFQVLLVNVFYNTHICGGVLINSLYVLTAAHCVDDGNYKNLYLSVIADTINFDNPRQVRFVREIIMHEKYSPKDSWANDIALVRLWIPLNLTVIHLPAQGEPLESGISEIEARLAGFGRISKNVPASRNLRQATVHIVPFEVCKDIYKNIEYPVLLTQTCAHDPYNNSAICVGDAGGPLIYKGKVVGILSWTVGCTRTDFPTVFTRVSSYSLWIEKNIFYRQLTDNYNYTPINETKLLNFKVLY